MTLLNSNFEEWRIANPTADFHDFQFTTNKMSVSGSLFDIDKLLDVSKNTVSMMTAEEVYEYVLDWAMQNDNELYGLFAANPDKAKSILAIGRGGAKPRKDIAIWKEVKDYVAFFYPELYVPAEASAYPENVSKEDCKAILEGYLANYDAADDNSQWFDKVRSMGESLGYAGKPKDYKKNPDQFKGHVGDVSAVIRLAVTGRTNSPDLCPVMQVLGQEEMERRVREAMEILK